MLPGVPRDVICENPAVPRGTLTVGGRMLAVETIGNDRLARGDVAQLVERLLCKQDVRSSNLLVSKGFFGRRSVACSQFCSQWWFHLLL